MNTLDIKAVSMNQAATILNTTTDAIRKRLKRGTLQGLKNEAGHWVVYLQADGPSGQDGDKGGSGRTAHLAIEVEPSCNGAPVACPGCMQLMIERAALTAQLEAQAVQIKALQADREAWQAQASKAHEQAQAVLQTWNNQQSLALPSAVKEMGRLTDGAPGLGLWARLRNAIKPPRE